MRVYFHRKQAAPAMHDIVKAGLGGMIGIALIAGLSRYSGNPWLMAPFGATCVLLFSVPSSPLSQPINVIGGHLASTLIGLAISAILPNAWWSMALAVGLSIAVMSALRITHPPAGADPLVVLATAPGWDFLLFPTLVGSVALVLAASVYHRVPPKNAYPLGE